MIKRSFTSIETVLNSEELGGTKVAQFDNDATLELTLCTAVVIFLGRAELIEEVEATLIDNCTGAASVESTSGASTQSSPPDEFSRCKISLHRNIGEVRYAIENLIARTKKDVDDKDQAGCQSCIRMLEFNTRCFGRIAILLRRAARQEGNYRFEDSTLIKGREYSIIIRALADRTDMRLQAITPSDDIYLSFAREILRQLRIILRLLTRATREQSVHSIRWYSDSIARTVAGAGSKPASTNLTERLYLEQFRSTVARCSDEPAVEAAGQVLTYADLDERSTRLAGLLRRLDVRKGEFIGLYLTRGADLIVGMLGILKAGAAFVPLDLSSPPGRLREMVEDAKINHILSLSTIAENLVNLTSTLTLLDGPWREIENVDDEDEAFSIEPASPAYAFFTSGSTGVPKAAAVSHNSLAKYVESISAHLQLGKGDRVLQIAPPGFDVIIEEVIPTLAAGACLIIPPASPLNIPHDVSALIRELRITVIELTTAYWHRWVERLGARLERPPETLRLVLIGGDHVSPRIFSQWALFGIELMHVYGTTETTCTSTVFHSPSGMTRLHPLWLGLPIGKPLDFCDVRVVDEEGITMPPLLPGELCIFGDGVGLGYINRPELTRQNFVMDSTRSGGGLHYRTGDYGRLLPDGNLEFIGRRDAQVKMRGYRIELREIEHALRHHPEIKDAVVVALDGPSSTGERTIGALISVNSEAPDETVIRSFLRNRLPAFMLPAHILLVKELPMLSNGKLDQRKAKQLIASRPQKDAIPTNNDVKGIISCIVMEVLGHSGFTFDDLFFEIGLDSLTLMEISVRLSDRLGYDISDLDVYMNPTVNRLALFVESRTSKTIL